MINPGLCGESVEEWKEIISLAISNSPVFGGGDCHLSVCELQQSLLNEAKGKRGEPFQKASAVNDRPEGGDSCNGQTLENSPFKIKHPLS